MDDKTINPEYAGPGDDRHLPRVMDPVVTMAAVQRYVEQERMRSRRLFVWTSTVFLLVILFVLAAFTLVGIYVMKHVRHSSDAIDSIREQSILQSAEMVVMSNTVSKLESSATEVRSSITDQEAVRARERKALHSDLKRFSEWVDRKTSGGPDRMTELLDRIQRMEKGQAEGQKELETVRNQNSELLAALAKGRLPAAAGPGDAKEVAENRAATPAASVFVAGPVEAPGKQGMDTEQPDRQGEAAGASLDAGAGAAAAAARMASPIEAQVSAPAAASRISVVSYPNGDRYEGEFKDGLLDGWGVYHYRNGDRYEGQFASDMKCGKGTLTSVNGDKYIGEFEKDMKCGRGSIVYANGDRFVGEFRDDTMNGKGTMMYANGNQYAGDFRNGLKHGNGVFTYSNGDSYSGEFDGDLRNGYGTYSFSNGARYIGDFKDDKRDGKGRYMYANGEEYIGEFKNGLKNGYGLCKYPNGLQVKGLWKEDRFLHALED